MDAEVEDKILMWLWVYNGLLCAVGLWLWGVAADWWRKGGKGDE